MINKDSNKNIGRIENYVARLKKIVEKCYECELATCEQCEICWADVRSIEAVLANLEALCDMQMSADRDLQKQKQINEEHQKINGELREKVKRLEEENRMFKNNKVLVSRYFKLKDNSIPKQKIKEMLEESQTLYEKKLKEIDFKELKSISLNIFEGIKLEVERGLLRRLLQESEDK